MKRLLAFLLLSIASMGQTAGAPVLFPAGSDGPFTNDVLVGLFCPDSGADAFYTKDGTTPGSAVSSSTYGFGGEWAYVDVTGTTIKAKCVKSGLTDSSVTTETYTINKTMQMTGATYSTPVAVTHAGSTIVDHFPVGLRAPNGDLFVWHTESYDGTGDSEDEGAVGRTMLKVSTDGGTSFHAWTGSTGLCTVTGDPAGCFLSAAGLAYGPSAAGIMHDGTTMLYLDSKATAGYGTLYGVPIARSTNNGATWSISMLTTPSYTADKIWAPNANFIAIPSGSSGVTGPCATGCDIIFAYVKVVSSWYGGLLFSYDGGATWDDPKIIPQTWPYQSNERAIFWAGGMKILSFVRNTWTASINGGTPQPMLKMVSSDLGDHWETWASPRTGLYSGPSNLQAAICTTAVGNTVYRVENVNPSGAVSTGNSALGAMLQGVRRVGCEDKSFWSLYLNFNILDAYNGDGLSMAQPLTLDIGNPSRQTPHAGYAWLTALPNGKFWMVYERPTTSTSEDIWSTIIDSRRRPVVPKVY